MNITPDHATVIYNSITKSKGNTVSVQPGIYESLFLGLNPKNILHNDQQEVTVVILDKEQALKYLSTRFNITSKDKLCQMLKTKKL